LLFLTSNKDKKPTTAMLPSKKPLQIANLPSSKEKYATTIVEAL